MPRRSKHTATEAQPLTTPPPVHNQTPSTLPNTTLSTLGLFLKVIGFTLLFFIILVALTAAGAYWFANRQLNTFTQTAGISRDQLWSTVRSGLQSTPTHTNYRKNFLLLGLDSLATRGDVPPLTDTMMLISLNLQTGEIITLSLPRDLWSGAYQTRLNALYAYGQERYPDEPARFPREVISDITGVPIHHTLTLTFDDVSELITMVGGIEVDVPQGFVDEEFPRTNVDVTIERDPAKLYERVEFMSGPQTMNGDLALKYIRSRHSEGDEGTDLARSQRQQLVIQALLKKASDPAVILDPVQLGKLYRFYLDTFGANFSPQEALGTLKMWGESDSSITFTNERLGVYPDDPMGELIHPQPRLYQGQWIYLPRDPQEFQRSVQLKLKQSPQ